MKTIKIKNNQLIEIDETKIKYANRIMNNLDASNIANEKELNDYIKNTQKEIDAMRLAYPILIKEMNITIIKKYDDRYHAYDCDAVSGVTNILTDKYDEDIILEFKTRYNQSSTDYSTVQLDEHKYNKLKEIYIKTKKRVFVVYTYLNDPQIRILELFKHNPDYERIDKFPSTAYSNTMKQRKNLYWLNDKTILI